MHWRVLEALVPGITVSEGLLSWRRGGHVDDNLLNALNRQIGRVFKLPIFKY
jgi:hypothetical protein